MKQRHLFIYTLRKLKEEGFSTKSNKGKVGKWGMLFCMSFGDRKLDVKEGGILLNEAK